MIHLGKNINKDLNQMILEKMLFIKFNQTAVSNLLDSSHLRYISKKPKGHAMGQNFVSL